MYNKKKQSIPTPVYVAAVFAGIFGGCTDSMQKMRGRASYNGLALTPLDTFESCDAVLSHAKSAAAVRHRNHAISVDHQSIPDNRAASVPMSSNSEIIGNRQESGVAEADFTAIGNHQIVRANLNKLTVLNRSDLKKVGVLYQAAGQQINGLYIEGNRLVVLVNRFGAGENRPVKSSSVSIFSLNEGAKPSLIVEKEFDQNIHHSRVTDGYLIAVLSEELTGEEKPEGSRIAGIECTSIAKPLVNPEGAGLTKVVAMEIQNPDKQESIIGAFAAGDQIYMNEENLFIAESTYNDVTGIHKIEFDSGSGKLRLSASGKAPGHLQDDFAMREVTLAGAKHLVLATNSEFNPDKKPVMGGWSEEPVDTMGFPSRNDRANNIFIISQKGVELIESGSITGIAPGEDIKAVRYVDEMAYIVTFRQVDPLFAISLQDPTEPKILGELKIPGYSEYLHPVAEGRLLGVGLDHSWNGRATGNVKVSLFDISNAEDLKEMATVTAAGDSEVNHDYKAFLYDVEENLAFVPVNRGAVIIKVDGDKLQKQTFIRQYGTILRAFKFDGLLFTVSTEQIVARDVDDPSKEVMKTTESI